MLNNAHRSRRLVRVSCAGCGRACYLHGKSHPEVTVPRPLGSDLPALRYCTRRCYDAAKAVAS